jgi:hypothetical protein
MSGPPPRIHCSATAVYPIREPKAFAFSMPIYPVSRRIFLTRSRGTLWIMFAQFWDSMASLSRIARRLSFAFARDKPCAGKGFSVPVVDMMRPFHKSGIRSRSAGKQNSAVGASRDLLCLVRSRYCENAKLRPSAILEVNHYPKNW